MRELPVVLLLALALLLVVRCPPLPPLDLRPKQLVHVHGQMGAGRGTGHDAPTGIVARDGDAMDDE